MPAGIPGSAGGEDAGVRDWESRLSAAAGGQLGGFRRGAPLSLRDHLARRGERGRRGLQKQVGAREGAGQQRLAPASLAFCNGGSVQALDLMEVASSVGLGIWCRFPVEIPGVAGSISWQRKWTKLHSNLPSFLIVPSRSSKHKT